VESEEQNVVNSAGSIWKEVAKYEQQTLSCQQA
jgi:hypothetical protein